MSFVELLLYLCYVMFGFISIVLVCFLSLFESGMFWNNGQHIAENLLFMVGIFCFETLIVLSILEYQIAVYYSQ